MKTETIELEKKEFHELSKSIERYLERLIGTTGWKRNKKGFWQTTITIKAK